MRPRGSPERNKIRIRTKRNKLGMALKKRLGADVDVMERSPKASARQRGRVRIDGSQRGRVMIDRHDVIVNKINIG